MKIFRIISLVMMMFWLTGTAVSAAPIASPTSYLISSVVAYSPAIEAGDQWFIVKFQVGYGTNPDENAGQAWLIRLFEDSTEIASTAPYAFYNDGYATGVASIYLTPSLAATWSGNVTIRLEPNPTLSWTSIPSPAIFSSIEWSTAATLDEVATEVHNKVRDLGLALNIDWSATANPILSYVGGAPKLTDRGASYFDVVMPLLRIIQPDLYLSAILMPQIPTLNYGNTYQQQADNQTTNTPFDQTSLGTLLGVSRMWATGLLWGLLSLGVSGTIGVKAQSAKPVFFLFGAMMIVGGAMGFGLLASVLFILLGTASLVLAFSWRGA